MITAIGTGIGDEFDIDGLRYHRIIVMTDADVDGSHIRTLVLTFLYRHMKELFERGHVYIAVPPLYKVKLGNQEYYFEKDSQLEDLLVRERFGDLEVRDRDGNEVKLTEARWKRFTVGARGVRGLVGAAARRLRPPRRRSRHLAPARRARRGRRPATVEKALARLPANGYTLSVLERDARRPARQGRRGVDVVGGARAARRRSCSRRRSTRTCARRTRGSSRSSARRRSRSRSARRPPTRRRSPSCARTALDLAKEVGIQLSRFKGLGEMNETQLWETTMDPTKRLLIRVDVEDAHAADQLFSMLMGDQVEPRRALHRGEREGREVPRCLRSRPARSARGRIEPRELEQEMRSSFLDYAMSVIVSRALPDVRDGLKPVHRRVLYGMHEAGPAAEPAVQEVRHHRRRRDGQVPPARRPGDLRHARAHGAAVLAALPARRRPGQLRLDRRRSAGGDALHRGAALAASRRRCCATSTRTPSTSSRTTTSRAAQPTVLPSRFPNLLVNGSTGIAVGMATNMPPHHLGETIDAIVAMIDNPDIDVEGLMKHVKGPDFPTGAYIVGRSRHPRRVSHRPRPHRHARARAHRGAARRQVGDRHHRASVRREEGRRHRRHPQDRRPRPGQGAHGDLRSRRPLRPHRHAHPGRAEARRDSAGRAQQALQAHAAAVDVRLQRRRARRRRAEDAVAARARHALPRLPARGRHPPLEGRAAQGRERARTSSRATSSRSTTSTRSSR